jgi:DNA-binding NarL/FixJ family response regulator
MNFRGMLSPADLRILELVAAGHNTPTIARKLRCNPKTVKFHVKKIVRLFGVPEERNHRVCLAVLWDSELFRAGLEELGMLHDPRRSPLAHDAA